MDRENGSGRLESGTRVRCRSRPPRSPSLEGFCLRERTGSVSWLEAASLAFPSRPQGRNSGCRRVNPPLERAGPVVLTGPLTVAGPRRLHTGLPWGPVRDLYCRGKLNVRGWILQAGGSAAGNAPAAGRVAPPRHARPSGGGQSTAVLIYVAESVGAAESCGIAPGIVREPSSQRSRKMRRHWPSCPRPTASNQVSFVP